jgi:hypothetical protein
MKKIIFSIVFTMLFSVSYAQTLETNFFANPLLINGKPMVSEHFSLSSRGVLTMVLGDPKLKETKRISFKIYLQRDNKVLKIEEAVGEKEQSEIEISRILRFAILGDELIIEPTDKKYRMAKRVISLKKEFLNYLILNFLNTNTKEGC